MIYTMKRYLFILCLMGWLVPYMHAQNVRERILFDENWSFAFGDASNPAKDFGCGTEYFNYLTKAASIHNEGPYSSKFDAKKWGKEWKTVNLPHDWVVDLPFAPEASHSHGYKTVGYKYPETSVGWYRKTFNIPAEDKGKHLYFQFDGIFRDARIWVNGFYLGHEPSGYATQIYDISEYLNYGGENIVAVRVDATLEEGWFYEGAGIYRHVWLNKVSPVHVAPFGVFVHTQLDEPFDKAEITIETTVANQGLTEVSGKLHHVVIDALGNEVATCDVETGVLQPKEHGVSETKTTLFKPQLWSMDTPYIYKVRTEVYVDNKLVDVQETKTGIRHIEFHADKGFLLNGKQIKLKGVNMHQDHAGVGAGIPDALQVYRLKELKKLGCNAYRSSHNPMTPEVLDACDSLGIVVIEENRLTGINEEHIRLLKRMIERDRNHPSIILWSVGNEEWGIEWNEFGERISASMREYCHRFDPTRPMCAASSSGPTILVPADVAGYNYILQNPVEEHRRNYPQRKALGSEETTGCGARGIYFDNHEKGYMTAINRHPQGPDSLYNCIERGWKFYDERPWLGGLFYWTGFDYRGEPNPMKYPATGSQFGILDYCGFPKDEAYYLKSWWTDEPVLHIFPHWNLQGHEGETIDVWAYSNCDEVELIVNGKKLGRKPMPKNGHLEWKATYQPGYVKAIGYKNGKRIITQKIETTGEVYRIALSADRTSLKSDNRDVAVCRIEMQDKKGRFVPNACQKLKLRIDGPARILGVGNGDPAYNTTERPTTSDARTYEINAFNGLAQVLVQSSIESGMASLIVEGDGGIMATLPIYIK